jgi:hypothetical protein
MEPGTLIIVLWSGLIAAMIYAVIRVLYLIRKNEKKRSKWIDDIGEGDSCSYHCVSGTSPDEMWISNIRPDGKYEITFVGQKSFLSPHKNYKD